MLKPMPYPEIYPPEEGEYRPLAIARTMFLDTVDDDVARTIVDYLGTSDAAMRVAQLRVLGGPQQGCPPTPRPMPSRASRIMVNVAAFYEGPEDMPMRQAWVEGFVETLRQGDTGAYVNFLADEGEARVHDAYPGPTWDRLVEVKRRYDPDNLFRLNQNIPPTG